MIAMKIWEYIPIYIKFNAVFQNSSLQEAVPIQPWWPHFAKITDTYHNKNHIQIKPNTLFIKNYNIYIN